MWLYKYSDTGSPSVILSPLVSLGPVLHSSRGFLTPTNVEVFPTFRVGRHDHLSLSTWYVQFDRYNECVRRINSKEVTNKTSRSDGFDPITFILFFEDRYKLVFPSLLVWGPLGDPPISHVDFQSTRTNRKVSVRPLSPKCGPCPPVRGIIHVLFSRVFMSLTPTSNLLKILLNCNYTVFSCIKKRIFK